MSNPADSSVESRSATVASLALERVVRSPVALVENLPIGVYTCDRDGIVVQFNRRAAELWGRHPALNDHSERFCMFAKGETSPMAQVLNTGRAVRDRELVVTRADGTELTIVVNVDPVHDEQGTLVGAVSNFQDVSALARLKRQLCDDQRRTDAQQRGLIDELNHRVKNTLVTIQSLAAQTMRGVPGDTAFEGRLLALSRVHDQLTRNAWEWADFAAIVADTAARRRGTVNSNFRIEGPSVPLNPRTALALGMVLHELACNASRHGALSTPAGAVVLSWRTEAGRLLIDWREKGGPAVAAPRKRGFGTRLLERSIAHELGGRPTIEFASAGVHCTMEIPLHE